jgi:PTH1 family peptidyl-tRNA hydrolase
VLKRALAFLTRLGADPARVGSRGAGARDPVEQRPEAGRTAASRAPSKLVVGLGNPGHPYVWTRHNAGFRVLETLAERHGGHWHKDARLQARVCSIELSGAGVHRNVLLIEPQTFMNRSGESVEAALETWPQLSAESDLLVVYDDLDLPTGRLRLRPSGGGGGHRGMGDILECLGTRAVPRLRFGIGHPGSADRVLDWVLQPFSAAEERDVLPDALARAADAVEAAAVEGITAVMGRFNARPPS